MKNSWCGIASISSKTSVLIKASDASFVVWALLAALMAWPVHLASATAALPATLVAWLVHLSLAAAAPLATSVAWVMQLCCGMLLALLTLIFLLYVCWPFIWLHYILWKRLDFSSIFLRFLISHLALAQMLLPPTRINACITYHLLLFLTLMSSSSYATFSSLNNGMKVYAEFMTRNVHMLLT